jgi:hypothetical protein
MGGVDPDGSEENPYSLIQDALSAAQPGYTILIHPGEYIGEGNRDLSPGGKDVTIISTDPNDLTVVAATVIDCQLLGRAFYLSGGETSACVISGLTVINGKQTGGAIRCDNSSPTIEKCVFADNTSNFHGGAIYLYNSDATISACLFLSNTSSNYGGAIYWRIGKSTIKNCIFARNYAYVQGGAIELQSCPDAQILNCTIAANDSANGGGVHCWQSSLEMQNCILWDNTADGNPQIGLNSTSSVFVDYSDVQDGWQGDHNFDLDPLFAAFDNDLQPADYDFHLQSTSGRWDRLSRSWIYDDITSPCIDSGHPGGDYLGEAWPHGKSLNIGAYGNTKEASKSGNIADLNVDGRVDWEDLTQFAAGWLDNGAGIVNLDLRGIVDLQDMAIFADNWGWEE